MSITVDGGILAGGRSTRMGGLDKGLQPYKNQAMVKWVYSALCPHVSTLYISCNQNLSSYQAISPNVCADTISGFQGPLAGLVSLMESSQADYLLVSPCDTPQLPNEYGSRMIGMLYELLSEGRAEPLLLAVKASKRSHPLHLCISTQYKNSLEAALNRGERKVMQWINANDPYWVDFSDFTDHFSNFNSKDDLVRTESAFSPDHK